MESFIDGSTKGLLWRLLCPQNSRAHHRRQGQRDHGGNQNRHREGNGKFAEEPSNDVTHEQKRDEYCDQRNGERYDGESDLSLPLAAPRAWATHPARCNAMMFSIITMASSTTNPVEMVSAISVRLFRL